MPNTTHVLLQSDMLGCMMLECECITAVHICHSKWAPTPVTPMTKGLGTSTLVAPIVEESERVGVSE